MKLKSLKPIYHHHISFCPLSLSPFLPPSFPTSLPPSLLPFLPPPSLHLSLPPSLPLPPSFLASLPPSLPPSLRPSLPPSLPPSFPLSLPPSLPPSYKRSFRIEGLEPLVAIIREFDAVKNPLEDWAEQQTESFASLPPIEVSGQCSGCQVSIRGVRSVLGVSSQC